MVKAIASKVILSEQDSETAVQYYREVEDIINAPEILLLKECTQHMNCSRLQHCINVSYYSFLMCRKLNLDTRAAARGGLLHDMFYYSWNGSGTGRKHFAIHPKIALFNAEKLTELSEVERDIIVKHMWPFFGVPSYKESFVVTMVDKYCTMLELAKSVKTKMRRRSENLKSS